MNKTKLNIGLDFDDVLSPFLPYTIEAINEKYNRSYTVEDIKGWNMLEYIDITWDQLCSIWTPEFVNSIPIKEEAVTLVNKLKSDGHNVYITTASWAPTHTDRVRKCKDILDIPEEDVIFIKHKHLLKLDLLVDDRIDNLLDEYGLPCENYERVLFDAPHNRNPKETNKLGLHYRANSLEDVYEIVNLIERNKTTLRYVAEDR